MSFRSIKLSINYTPTEIISWEEAFDLVYIRNQASIAWEYPEKYKIRSQYLSWNYPSIIVLKEYKKVRPEKRDVNPSLRAILVRDLYTCQYCSKKLTNSTGTRDHIIPESKKGPNTFSNLVACCRDCQSIKADKYLHETNLKLIRTPTTPKLSERVSNSIMCASSFERNSWKLGFKNLGLDYILTENEKELEAK